MVKTPPKGKIKECITKKLMGRGEKNNRRGRKDQRTDGTYKEIIKYT